MSPNNPHLAFELHEAILSHLASDLIDHYSTYYQPNGRLANYALVCRAWRSIVQPWMFAGLTINPDRIQHIWEFLRKSSASHHLSKHVKMIEIMDTDHYAAAVHPFSAVLEAMNEREMFRLFNNVEFLMLTVCRDTFTNEDITLLSQFRRVRKMQLSLPFFHHLASYFPDLTHLNLSCHPMNSSPIPDQTEALNVQNLQRLGICLGSTPGFPAWLTVYAPRLEHLALMWASDRSWKDLASIARNLIASIPLENIKTVNLTEYSWDDRDVISDPILSIKSESYFMRKFVNLQSLGLNYLITRGSIDSPRPLTCPDTEPLVQILSAVSGKHLRTLVLVVSFHYMQRHELPVYLTFDDPKWKVVDELLCDDGRFRVLGKVMLVMDYADLSILLKMFNHDRIFGLVDIVKMAFKGLTSTRRLQLILRKRMLDFPWDDWDEICNGDLIVDLGYGTGVQTEV